MNVIVFLYLMVLSFVACSGKGSEENNTSHIPDSTQVLPGYRINEPSRVYELPEELEEVSGMAAVSPTQLLLNEDENGKLYLFDLQKGSVEKEVKWGEDGDYEGTAIVGETAYVVNSKGTVFRIENFKADDPEVEEYKNEALEECDVEGLHYLKDENVLLIACKEGTGKEERSIYSFSLENHSLQPDPYRVLDLKEIEDRLLTNGFDQLSVGLKKFLDPKGESGILFPSGIAVHPETGEWFILSSQSKLLVVYSGEGELKNVVELRNELFLQPESIAFTPNGDLYIGNEGRGGEPNILKFEYVKE